MFFHLSLSRQNGKKADREIVRTTLVWTNILLNSRAKTRELFLNSCGLDKHNERIKLMVCSLHLSNEKVKYRTYYQLMVLVLVPISFCHKGSPMAMEGIDSLLISCSKLKQILIQRQQSGSNSPKVCLKNLTRQLIG